MKTKRGRIEDALGLLVQRYVTDHDVRGAVQWIERLFSITDGREDGILLDWYVHLTPHLDRSKVIRWILHEREGRMRERTPLIVSTLLDSSSWKNLRICAEELLKEGQDINEDVALDFISSYENHPRSWLGYVHPSDDVHVDTISSVSG